jgi:cysteine desulfurase
MAVYLDYNSTTPVDPRVLEAMLPYFTEKFGNAASKTHSFGWVAEAAVEQARERVAKLINATPHEIIFTSGATEAINLAIKGVYETHTSPFSFGEGSGLPAGQAGVRRGEVKNHIITVSTEHKAVLDTCQYLESKGAQVTYLPVNREGLIDLGQLSNSITPSTLLVCVMYANNETGVIQPIHEISKIVHGKNSSFEERQGGCLFMCDATQAVGKIKVDVENDGIDLLCLSAHKIYGPKGTGALFVRRKNPRVTLLPLIHGGGHERGLRSGTLNVPGIVGLGKACEIAEKEIWDDAQRVSQLRTLLEQKLIDLGRIFVNGSIKHRMPNVTNLSFSGIKADSLIAKLPDIAVSTGSACTSAIPEPSHVLKAMGMTDEMAYSSVRFSLGKYTTQHEVEYAIDKISKIIREIKPA